MIEQWEVLTLPERMRLAADVLRLADDRYGSKYSWSPDGLEIYAARWEDEDRKAAEREALAEQLASHIYQARYPGITWGYAIQHQDCPDRWRDAARKLIESGWTKGVQPLGERPEVDSWLGVRKAIGELLDTGLAINRELTTARAQIDELRRENVALTTQRDHARNQADTWRIAAAKGLAP